MLETKGDATCMYYKLTQKIPALDGWPGLISTTYLNEEEFALLSTLPGSAQRKTRYSIPPFGVDVFDPPLVGLILAEYGLKELKGVSAIDGPTLVGEYVAIGDLKDADFRHF
jgi:hypothetical protein